MAVHQYEARCVCGNRWRVYRTAADDDEDPMATCINCGGPKLEPVQLARGGTVQTYVINHTMPAPFVAPLPIAVLDMDDGARLMLQVVGDGSDVSIGRVVRLVLRKYAHERGVPVYGFKAQPVRAEEKVS